MDGNYVAKLAAFITANGLQPHQVIEVNIAHDDWCALLTRGAPCDCDPTISWTPPDQRWFPTDGPAT